MTYQPILQLKTLTYKRCIEPRSSDPDSRRREFILNVLLFGLVSIAVVALVVSGAAFLSKSIDHNSGSFVSTALFALVVIGLLVASRRGYPRMVAYAFLVMLTLAATQFVAQWSFELPEAQLAYAVIIVMTGILLTARTALIWAGVISILVLGFSIAQINDYLHPDLSWLYKPFAIGDAVGYVVIFAFIGLISWLSNREIDRSLERALASEAALAKERDTLEIKVLARTQELEQLQLARLLELQRFAEFGRLSSGLLHEVSNPLTAASLNLQQLSKEQHSTLVLQVQRSLHQLERYVQAARKQLQGESRVTTFSVRSEINQLLKLLAHKAKKAEVKIVLEQQGSFRVHGDPVKFSQIMANLLANAIESYDGQHKTLRRQVLVEVSSEQSDLLLTVSDWGKGISQDHLDQLFDPFYTTKVGVTQRGMGIGLALVKQFVEEDFSGSITVSSSSTEGTSFRLRLPLKELPV